MVKPAGAWLVRRNGRIRGGFPDAESAIRFVADETGVDAENVASETRGGRPLVVDAGADGRSREDVWTLEEVPS